MVDEIPQDLAKVRSVTVEIFCIFVTLYTKTGLTKQTVNLVSCIG